MSIDFARELREGTKKAHTMAENTGFVSCFLKGVVDQSSYRLLIADLYFVYSAMEEEILRLCDLDHPIISSIYFPELNRKKALEEDLFFFYGSNWHSEVKPTESAKKYVDRIQEIAKESPELLIGHHYTRYIGDLSGGQILKSIAKKALNLSENGGLSFYNFPLVKDEKLFKQKYSQTLNTLEIDQPMVSSIVDEANNAFKYNMNIFQELEGNLISAIGKVLFRMLTDRKRRGSTE